jgi:hypothetical protein
MGSISGRFKHVILQRLRYERASGAMKLCPSIGFVGLGLELELGLGLGLG